ncbi:hypothetical protein P3F83_18030 [Mycobacteroides immunogenum]|nr:hypothetical protein [Mycobacteroides immunogenum]WJR32410.1 hypothetical protein P3F83_18030 [Mycobacteroides immunogenum]
MKTIANYIRFARSVRRVWKRRQSLTDLVFVGELDQAGQNALAALAERAK